MGIKWNWELSEWPGFSYNGELLVQSEKQFLLSAGSSIAFLKSIEEQDYRHFTVEILSTEGLESSKIEGELLDRESLQSSIKKHFGLNPTRKKEHRKESQMADVLWSVYETFQEPLTHKMMWDWHARLFEGYTYIEDRGMYRSHPEPMQIVSNRYDTPRVFFEAPPSSQVLKEMDAFILWFNRSSSLPILGRAAIAHAYFESIHPFEDGNGRIGRLLVEKILSQGVERSVLIAVSKILEQRKKDYYAALETCNRTLEITSFVQFFAAVILKAQEESMNLLKFLIAKSQVMTTLKGQINPRQEKVLLRIFAEGPNGFAGGLSAENYIAITKTSRATATRDLNELVQLKVFIKTGELRHTRYWLNLEV